MKIELVNLAKADYSLQLDVRNWRNADHVAKYFQISYIDEETHENWLKSLNEEKPKNIAFLIKVNDSFVGLAYFLKIDYIQLEVDWGMYIYNEDLRGLGIGQKTIELSIDYIKSRLDCKKIKLEVLKSNKNAIKLYEKNSFKYIKEVGNVLYYQLAL